MFFKVITIFPQMFESYLKQSILKKAIDSEKIKIDLSGHNPGLYFIEIFSGDKVYQQKVQVFK